MDSIFRLMYLSTSTDDHSDEAIAELVEAASQNNEREAITGILAYNGMTFLQILEGDRQKVLTLVDSIRRDERHTGLTIASEIEDRERAYPEWGMRRIDTIDVVTLTAYFLDTHFKPPRRAVAV